MITATTTKKSKGTNTCEYIVLHHTGDESSLQNQVDYLSKNPAQVSCHYVVGIYGEVGKIGEDTDILWHAGVSSWDGKENMNKYSIGIEVISKGVVFSDEQRIAVRSLVYELMQKHNIPAKNILRHKDITSRKIDIGDNFWNDRFVTFNDYKESFKRPVLTIEQIDLIKTYMALASNIYHLVPNKDIRNIVHNTNESFRKLGI